MQMRGGTSKGLYFLADDLPDDPAQRDRLLLRLMGSPDRRQIDGLGGAHPLTSKVAVVSAGRDENGDSDGSVDYLFLQVGVDQAVVSDGQNCGNILAGVAPFALERGIVPITGDTTTVRINLLNSHSTALATVETPNGTVRYTGNTAIVGVPGTAAGITLEYCDVAGGTTGALFPTGSTLDTFRLAEHGPMPTRVEATCIDNGMPVVVLDAAAFGLDGNETVEELEADTDLRATIEELRLKAGRSMGLGDVTEATVPKLCLVSPAQSGGDFSTRCFIPHRVHEAIGVFAAASVGAAWRIPGTVLARLAQSSRPGDPNDDTTALVVEHPTGQTTIVVETNGDQVTRTASVSTARKLMDGIAFAETEG